jgi:Ribbon-helix-helix protein, copG family
MRAVPMKTYLDPELARAIARIAAAQGRSESAIIAEAIRARLASNSDAALKGEGDTMKRQLNRIEARLDKIAWEEMQIKACVLLFIRVWLEHNPPLDAELEDSAAASAEARFARFLDLLANDLTNPGAIDDLSERRDESERPDQNPDQNSGEAELNGAESSEAHP